MGDRIGVSFGGEDKKRLGGVRPYGFLEIILGGGNKKINTEEKKGPGKKKKTAIIKSF